MSLMSPGTSAVVRASLVIVSTAVNVNNNNVCVNSTFYVSQRLSLGGLPRR